MIEPLTELSILPTKGTNPIPQSDTAALAQDAFEEGSRPFAGYRFPVITFVDQQP